MSDKENPFEGLAADDIVGIQPMLAPTGHIFKLKVRYNMKDERTLAIIKPDAVSGNCIGEICKMIEGNFLKIEAMRMIYMTEDFAKDFYAEHEGKDFFKRNVDFMCSGPMVVMVLNGMNAISNWRKLMGATLEADRVPGTVRYMYGSGTLNNAVHGSDSEESAEREIGMLEEML